MDEQRTTIEALAEKRGYTATFHDGLCDLRDTLTGMLWRDAPLEDAAQYLRDPINGSGITDALLKGINLDQYDAVVGRLCYADGTAVLLHRTGPGPHWNLVTRSTSQFHNFGDMALYATALCGMNRRDDKRYTTLRRAYRQHLETGTPLRELL